MYSKSFICINAFKLALSLYEEGTVDLSGKMSKPRQRGLSNLPRVSGRAGVQTQVIWLHFRGIQPTLFVYGVLELHCQRYKKCLSGLWSGDAQRNYQSNVTHYGWVFA